MRFEDQVVFFVNVTSNTVESSGKTYFNINFLNGDYSNRCGVSEDVYKSLVGTPHRDIKISGSIRFYKGSAFLNVDSFSEVD